MYKTGPAEDHTVNTTDVVDPDTTDFAVRVSGPPCVLNNIVFTAGLKGKNFFSNCKQFQLYFKFLFILDDVHLKQYVGKTLSDLELKHLVNWPHVSVNFMFPNLVFSRRNMHEFNRCISSSARVLSKPQKRDRIFHVKRLGPESRCKVYTAEFIMNSMSGVLSSVYSSEEGVSGKLL